MMRIGLYQRYTLLYFFACFCSIGISAWINLREAVINPDAICYLYSAEEIGKSSIQTAMHLCPQAIWPFYSAFIFLLQQLTHLSYLNTAYVLDGAFSALSVLMFLAIIQALGGRLRTLVIASVVILLAHEFNILRKDIIRDHGFWAFYLSSIWLLLSYFNRPHWMKGFLWGTSLLLATAFRIEGAFFLLFMPFVAWLLEGSWQKRCKDFVILHLPLLLVFSAAITWFCLHPQFSLQQWGRVGEISHQLQSGIKIIIEQYQLLQDAVANSIMNHNSMRDAGLVVVLLLFSWYIINVINSVSWIYAILILYAWVVKAARFTAPAGVILLGYILINFLITFGFFAQNHFLAKRYLIAFSLVLMVWVPFALEKILEVRNVKQQVFMRFAVLLMAVSAIGGFFHFGHSKEYIRFAGNWLASNVPHQAQLYTNDYQLMYYSQHFGSQIFQKREEYQHVATLANGNWKQYDYLALLISKGDKVGMLMQEMQLIPLKVFISNKGDHVYIYKISHQETLS